MYFEKRLIFTSNGWNLYEYSKLRFSSEFYIPSTMRAQGGGQIIFRIVPQSAWHKDGYILISLLLLHWSIPTQHNELWPPVTSFAFSFNLHAHDSRSHLPWCVSVVRTSHDLLCACFKKGKTHILCMKTLKWRRNVLNTQFKIDRIHYITYSQWFNSLVS